jgi:hypothetical protein
MPGLPRRKVRFEVVPRRNGFSIVDNTCHKRRKLGFFRDEKAAKEIADARNAEWRRAITSTKET